MNAGNWTALTRIAWKDMRRIGGLWVALVGLWIALLLCSGAATLRFGNVLAPTRDETLLLILATAMIYGLSWAGITFAAEHDDKTYGHLRSLPVNTHELFYGKMLFGVGSMLVLVLALGLMSVLHAWCLYRIEPSYQWHNIWTEIPQHHDTALWLSQFAMLIPVAVTLGLFWSLRVTNPLQALGLAAVSLVLFGIGCILLGGLPAVAGSALASVAIFVADWRLVQSWFPSKVEGRNTAKAPTMVETRLGRLFWLQGRLSSWWVIGLSGLLLVLVTLSSGSTSRFAEAIYVLSCVNCGWLGVAVFRSEHQEKRYRWLAQLGTRPFEYWASRLLVPGVASIVAANIPMISIHAHDLGSSQLEFFGILSGCSLTAFCLGQFWSLAMSSIVLAVALTLLTTMIASAWIVLCAKIDIPFWLSPGPLLLFPLLASYLRISRWFRDTGSWKQWVVPSLPLALLVLGLPIGTACYRVYEVPSVAIPSEMLAEIPQPTADELVGQAELNTVLIRLPSGLPPNLLEPWASDNPIITDELLRIAQRPFILPSEFDGIGFVSPSNISVAIELLLIRGSYETAAGDADQGWRFYRAALELAWKCQGPRAITIGIVQGSELERRVYRELIPWAMRENTNAEQIESAATFIDSRRQALSPCEDYIRYTRRFYLNHLKSLAANTETIGDTTGRLFIRLLPWEIARAKRLSDYMLVKEFQQAQRHDAPMNPISARDRDFERWRSSTLFPTFAPSSAAVFYQDAEQNRRGVICQLAAIAHHKEHGFYPKDLTNLIVGGRSLPDDVYVGRKMVLMGVEEGKGPGLRIVSPAAGNVATGSDMGGQFRHFLLPAFEGWKDQQNEEQVARHSPPIPADESPGILFDRLNTKLADRVALFAVQSILRDNLPDLRKELLALFKQDPALALEFVPELAQRMDSAEDVEAAFVANILSTTLKYDAIAVREKVPDSQRLFSFDALANECGVPVRNSANGHFYELVPGASDLDQVRSTAARRTYRGIPGQIAVMASPSDSSLLQAMAAAQEEEGVTVVAQRQARGALEMWRLATSHALKGELKEGFAGKGMEGVEGKRSNQSKNDPQVWQRTTELPDGSEFSILVEYDPNGTDNSKEATP